MEGREKPYSNKYKEIMNDRNNDAKCTLTSLPVWDLENFKSLIFVAQCVYQKLLMTMADRKVCNALAYNESQKCSICGASPKDVNKEETLKEKRVAYPTMYAFGLSTLHALSYCFECVSHIAYRLNTKK
jgi:hypothetical protein